MTISELIKILESQLEAHGDVFVERHDGREPLGVAGIFEVGKKNPKVIAVKIQ
jgi:hypothetical protein